MDLALYVMTVCRAKLPLLTAIVVPVAWPNRFKWLDARYIADDRNCTLFFSLFDSAFPAPQGCTTSVLTQRRPMDVFLLAPYNEKSII
jgi:hypothetical protein